MTDGTGNRFDRIWDKLLELSGGMGDIRQELGGVRQGLLSLKDTVKELANYQGEQNGNAKDVLLRLESLELASAEECGEQRGARRQWLIIAGVITATSCIATTVGIIIGLVVR